MILWSHPRGLFHSSYQCNDYETSLFQKLALDSHLKKLAHTWLTLEETGPHLTHTWRNWPTLDSHLKKLALTWLTLEETDSHLKKLAHTWLTLEEPDSHLKKLAHTWRNWLALDSHFCRNSHLTHTVPELTLDSLVLKDIASKWLMKRLGWYAGSPSLSTDTSAITALCTPNSNTWWALMERNKSDVIWKKKQEPLSCFQK